MTARLTLAAVTIAFVAVGLLRPDSRLTAQAPHAPAMPPVPANLAVLEAHLADIRMLTDTGEPANRSRARASIGGEKSTSVTRSTGNRRAITSAAAPSPAPTSRTDLVGTPKAPMTWHIASICSLASGIACREVFR